MIQQTIRKLQNRKLLQINILNLDENLVCKQKNIFMFSLLMINKQTKTIFM